MMELWHFSCWSDEQKQFKRCKSWVIRTILLGIRLNISLTKCFSGGWRILTISKFKMTWSIYDWLWPTYFCHSYCVVFGSTLVICLYFSKFSRKNFSYFVFFLFFNTSNNVFLVLFSPVSEVRSTSSLLPPLGLPFHLSLREIFIEMENTTLSSEKRNHSTIEFQ